MWSFIISMWLFDLVCAIVLAIAGTLFYIWLEKEAKKQGDDNG